MLQISPHLISCLKKTLSIDPTVKETLILIYHRVRGVSALPKETSIQICPLVDGKVIWSHIITNILSYCGLPGSTGYCIILRIKSVAKSVTKYFVKCVSNSILIAAGGDVSRWVQNYPISDTEGTGLPN